MTLSEPELHALEALSGYGTDAFLTVFYEKLGTSYLQKHEKGLRSLFAAIQEELPRILSRADAARKAFNTANPVILDKEEHERLCKARVELDDVKRRSKEAGRCIQNALDEIQPGGPANPQEAAMQTLLGAAMGTLGEPLR